MSDSADIHVIATNRTEREVAEDLKSRLTAALEPVLALCKEANAVGLDVQIGFTRDKFGQLVVTPTLAKYY